MWHAVHAVALAKDKEAASDILQEQTRRSPWHAQYAQPFPPPRA